MWTDGRYFLQANQELDGDWTLMKDGISGTPSIEDWLIETLPQGTPFYHYFRHESLGSTVGCDGWCTRYNGFLKYKSKFESRNLKFATVDNPIDAAWTDKPERPAGELEIMQVAQAGQSWQDKLAAVREEIKKEGCQVCLYRQWH